MTFKDRLIDFIVIAIALAVAFGLLWYGISQKKTQIPLPAILIDSLPLDANQLPPGVLKLAATHITPYPDEKDISTYPQIIARFKSPLGASTQVTISPRVAFTPVYSDDRRSVVITQERPLNPNTSYIITIIDDSVNGIYRWSFTTNNRRLEPRYVSAIDRVKEQLPYTDPNSRFIIAYAPQTDIYFITVREGIEFENDKNAAYGWLKSQGIANPEILHITFLPGGGF